MKTKHILALAALVALVSVAEAQPIRTNRPTARPSRVKSGTDSKTGYVDPRLTSITNELRLLEAKAAVANAKVESLRPTKQNGKTARKVYKDAKAAADAIASRRAKLLADIAMIKAQRKNYGH